MAAENDPYDLARFVAAQDSSGTYRAAFAEIRAGRKTGHWMWFVFPQVAGLGRSPVAQHYAISGLAEARAYFAHPVLGLRLRECAAALLDVEDRTALQIFGGIDEMKLRSSMTLFAKATASEHRRRVGAEERSELSQDSAEQSGTAKATASEHRRRVGAEERSELSQDSAEQSGTAKATASEPRRRVGAEERSEHGAEQSDTAKADSDETVFRAVLDRYFHGRDDDATSLILGHAR